MWAKQQWKPGMCLRMESMYVCMHTCMYACKLILHYSSLPHLLTIVDLLKLPSADF